MESIGALKHLVLDFKLDDELGGHGKVEVSFIVTVFDAEILPAVRRLIFQGKIGSVTAQQASCRFYLIDVTYSRAERPTRQEVPVRVNRVSPERDKLDLEEAQTRLNYAEKSAGERFNGVNRFTNEDHIHAETLNFLAKRASRNTYSTGDYKTAVLRTEEAIAAYEKSKP